MDSTENINTYFDSPEKDPLEKVLSDSGLLKKDPNIFQMLEAFPDIALILNGHRQIVLCNSAASTLFNINDIISLEGKRFGEAFECIHKDEMNSGCGTSRFCRECGAAKALLKTRQENAVAEEECRIKAIRNGKEVSFDFYVKTKPFSYNSHQFTIFAVRDISGDKWRDSLENIFFHDVLNTATAIGGLAELLSVSTEDNDKQEIIDVLKGSIGQLLNEIVAQREIRNAEDGNLAVNMTEVSALSVVSKLHVLYAKHLIAKSKKIIFKHPESDILLNTDSTLLTRAISNLLKNALEATSDGGTVNIDFQYDEDSIQFNVQNEDIIPQNIAVQLFQRSFSTKEEKGHGLGLYSVKLIVENYLGGKVCYVSDEIHKTVFSIELPLK